MDGVAAVAPYDHAYAPGEAGGLCVVPLMVDGLIHPSAMLMLNYARRKIPMPALAR